MAKKIVWRIKGFEEIRRAPGVKADLKRRAERIAAASGAGFVAETGEGRTRSRAAVVTESAAAKRDANAMVRNLDAGR